MKCPNCPDSTLVMTDKQGVEIDYCPTCRGIWLDRGELDKLLDRAAAAASPAPLSAPAPAQARPAPPPHYRGQPDFEDSDFRKGQGYYRGKKKSWLNEIFD
jgi:Zn-finger nucleic acid-binding protein